MESSNHLPESESGSFIQLLVPRSRYWKNDQRFQKDFPRLQREVENKLSTSPDYLESLQQFNYGAFPKTTRERVSFIEATVSCLERLDNDLNHLLELKYALFDMLETTPWVDRIQETMTSIRNLFKSGNSVRSISDEIRDLMENLSAIEKKLENPLRLIESELQSDWNDDFDPAVRKNHPVGSEFFSRQRVLENYCDRDPVYKRFERISRRLTPLAAQPELTEKEYLSVSSLYEECFGQKSGNLVVAFDKLKRYHTAHERLIQLKLKTRYLITWMENVWKSRIQPDSADNFQKEVSRSHSFFNNLPSDSIVI